MNPPQTALIIDDEKQIRRLLRIVLEDSGYRVFEADTGKDGVSEVAHHRPDVVLLDMGLPDMSGMDVLVRLREWTQVPILVLTVRDEAGDKVAALDGGADDYVTKPFDTSELLARLRVIQRHALNEVGEPVFESGRLRVDLSARSVAMDGLEIKLTPTEYSLLRVLVQNAGKVVTHRQLLRSVWGDNAEDQVHYLRVYITHLRRKLETQKGPSRLIRNEVGVGYRMDA